MSPRVFPSWFPVLVLILAWSKYASIVQCAGKLPLTDVFRRISAELGTAHGYPLNRCKCSHPPYPAGRFENYMRRFCDVRAGPGGGCIYSGLRDRAAD
jgi:hypothetical protein